MINLSKYNPLTYGINSLRWVILSHTLPASTITQLTTNSFISSLLIFILFIIIITFLSLQLFQKLT